MNKRKGFWLIVLAQVIFLLGMIALKQATLIYGNPILLKTEPIDPRSLFRGDYVRLSYEISQIDKAKYGIGEEEYRENDEIWVLLEKGEKYWQVKTVAHQKGEVTGEQVWLKGTVEYSGWNGQMPVKYGIETYFVPEGQGLVLEQQMSNLEVEVKVDKRGSAAVSRIMLKGKEVKFE